MTSKVDGKSGTLEITDRVDYEGGWRRRRKGWKAEVDG